MTRESRSQTSPISTGGCLGDGELCPFLGYVVDSAVSFGLVFRIVLIFRLICFGRLCVSGVLGRAVVIWEGVGWRLRQQFVEG